MSKRKAISGSSRASGGKNTSGDHQNVEPENTFDPSTPADVFLPYVPTPDRDSKPYWEALSEGRFELQRCRSCETLRWPARAFCNRCRSFDHGWEATEGSGRIVSWVRTHQAFSPDLRTAVPYLVVQVALTAQPDLLLIGGWGVERTPVSGEDVKMDIVAGKDGFRFPCWTPAG